jgi:protein-tyrosine kinase
MSKIQDALKNIKNKNAGSSAATAHLRAAPSNDPSQSGHFLALDPKNISLSRVPKTKMDTDVFQDSRLILQNSETRHPAQGAYKMLRTRLMRVMRSNNWRILGVSSIGPNEGKTFTSINLAISIAAEVGQEAILIDLDLRKPSVSGYMGIVADNFTSVREYIQNGERDLSEILVGTDIDRLGLILGSDPLDRSSDILASPRGIKLFTELRERIHQQTVIIVDLPPLLAADDALTVAPMLDALLLVVAEGQAERSDLVEVRHLVENFNLIGTVLNKSKDKDSKRANYY